MDLPPDRSLVPRFFGELESAAETKADGRPEAVTRIGLADIILIAEDAADRASFREIFRKLNDVSLQDAVKDYMADVVNDLESASERSEIKVDLVDRAGMVPSASVAVAGVVAMAGTGVSAAAFLLAGGLIGIVASGVGRTWLRMRAQQSKASARKVRQLRDSLK